MRGIKENKQTCVNYCEKLFDVRVNTALVWEHLETLWHWKQIICLVYDSLKDLYAMSQGSSECSS